MNVYLGYTVFTMLVSWLFTPTMLNYRDALRRGKGNRHRTPGLPKVRPVSRPGRHRGAVVIGVPAVLPVRPRAEKVFTYATDVAA